MRLTFPEAHAAIESHTIDTDRGVVAGYLVRCTSSRAVLGYIWQAGNAWRWKSAGGFGERSTPKAAVQVCRDVFDLEHNRPKQPALPEAWRVLRSTPTPTPKASPRPAAAPQATPAPAPAPTQTITAQRIVWDDGPTGDLTSAIADAFRRQS